MKLKFLSFVVFVLALRFWLKIGETIYIFYDNFGQGFAEDNIF